MSSSSKWCGICNRNEFKYNCPKCGINYCSLDCYKSEKHEMCSETFYKQCVIDELQLDENRACSKQKMEEILRRLNEEQIPVEEDLEGNGACSKQKMEEILRRLNEEQIPVEEEDLEGNGACSKQKMEEILRRLNEEQIPVEEEDLEDSDDDVDNSKDLANRLTDVDLDNADVWKYLNEEEKSEFKNLVSSGAILDMIPEWEPWWISDRQLILECDNEDSEGPSIPAILTEIPSLAQLSKQPASQLLLFSICQIISCYSFITRWFKGVHHEMVLESATTFYLISSVLHSNDVFDTVQVGLQKIHLDVKKLKWVQYDSSLLETAKQDMTQIAKDRIYMLSALSDCYELFTEAHDRRDSLKNSLVKTYVSNIPTSKQLFLASKKILYFLSYVTSVTDYPTKVERVLCT